MRTCVCVNGEERGGKEGRVREEGALFHVAKQARRVSAAKVFAPLHPLPFAPPDPPPDSRQPAEPRCQVDNACLKHQIDSNLSTTSVQGGG